MYKTQSDTYPRDSSLPLGGELLKGPLPGPPFGRELLKGPLPGPPLGGEGVPCTITDNLRC